MPTTWEPKEYGQFMLRIWMETDAQSIVNDSVNDENDENYDFHTSGDQSAIDSYETNMDNVRNGRNI
jgi:hypothetical protein